MFVASLVRGQFSYITNFSGTATYGGVGVTVTSGGGVDNYAAGCLGPPTQYWIGVSAPGWYEYTCSSPIYAIQVHAYGLNGGPADSGEYLQMFINGSPYALTTANMNADTACGCSGHCGSCYLYGGLLFGPVGNIGDANGATFTINYCSGITSFRVADGNLEYGITYHIAIDTSLTMGAITGPGSVCVGATITLSDTSSGGTWGSSNPGVARIAGGVVTGISPGTAVISYTATIGCGRASATTVIKVNALASTGFITGPAHVCVPGPVLFTDDTSGGTWESTNARVASIGSLTGEVTGIVPGTATIRYVTDNGCGADSTSTTITVVAPPDAGLITGTTDFCAGTNDTLTDGQPGGLWSSRDSTIADVSAGVVAGIAAGTTVVSYSVSSLYCTSVATAPVTIKPLPDAGIITSDLIHALCAGMMITVADSAVGGVWSIANANASLTGQTVTAITPGPDTVFYSVTNDCGTRIADFPMVVLPPLPPITGTLKVCAGDTTMLYDTSVSGVWSGGAPLAQVITTLPDTGFVAGLSAGTASITFTEDSGCTALATLTVLASPDSGLISGQVELCVGASEPYSETEAGTWACKGGAAIDSGTGLLTANDTGTVIVIHKSLPNVNGCTSEAYKLVQIIPSPVVIMGTASPASCFGYADGSISCAASGGSSPYIYTWSNGKTSPDINGLASGMYIVSVTDTPTRCKSTDSFTVAQPDSMVVIPDIDNDACQSGIGRISLQVAGGAPPYRYAWASGTSSELTGLFEGAYSVTITDSRDCRENYVFIVKEDSCKSVVVHDVITPNGDGINDVWVIDGLQQYPKNQVNVFDKWGALVYAKSEYNNDWDGIGKGGAPLPDGTYFYLVLLNQENGAGGGNVYKGTILIKR